MTGWYQFGEVNTAVLQDRVGVSLDLDLFLAIPAAFYTFESPVLGGTYTIAVAVPFGYGKLTGRLEGPEGNSLSADDDSFNLSDIAITPTQNGHLETFP